MPDYAIRWDGDVWIVYVDEKPLDGFTDLGDACEAIAAYHKERTE